MVITACSVRLPRSKIKGLGQAVSQPANVTLSLEDPSCVGPITPVMTDLWNATGQSGLRGVILEWMGCVLYVQKDSTEEGTVIEIEQNTVTFYRYIVPTPFILSATRQSFTGKTGICRSNGTSAKVFIQKF